jgi:RES domain-containing protein
LTVVAWRIVKRKFAASAFSGEGARQFGGRWNSQGTVVIYTAQSQALAALEILVNVAYSELLAHYIAVPVTIDSSLISVLDQARLPKDWRADPAPVAVRALGDEWCSNRLSTVLQVPSAVIPAESNFLLNPLHPDFCKLDIGKASPFRFDTRLRGR